MIKARMGKLPKGAGDNYRKHLKETAIEYRAWSEQNKKRLKALEGADDKEVFKKMGRNLSFFVRISGLYYMP